MLPLFDGGRRRAVVDLRELQQQQAAVAYQQTVLKAWHDVDAAISAYTAERNRYERLGARLLAAEDAQVLARIRFERGLTDDAPALDAHRVLLDAERDRAESHGRLGLALVAVYQALGSEDGQQ
jgi:outer membrane protein TolC